MQIAVNTLSLKSGSIEDLQQIFKIRKKTFVNRLNWNVQAVGDYEMDDFDNGETDYIVIRQMGEIKATCRLIPTSEPTMLSEVFPELLRGEELMPGAVEISRLSAFEFEYVRNNILAFILQGLRNYAEATGTKEFVFVTTTSIERLLLRYNLDMRRFGDGMVTEIGGVPSVAIRLSAASIPSMN